MRPPQGSGRSLPPRTGPLAHSCSRGLLCICGRRCRTVRRRSSCASSRCVTSQRACGGKIGPHSSTAPTWFAARCLLIVQMGLKLEKSLYPVGVPANSRNFLCAEVRCLLFIWKLTTFERANCTVSVSLAKVSPA